MSKVIIYTHNNPPKVKGEVFTKPSETDQLANEDINDVFRRCCVDGRFPASAYGADVELTEQVEQKAQDEAKAEAAFADSALDDVSGLDRVEQADILHTVELLAEQVRKSASVARKKPENGAQGIGAGAASADGKAEPKASSEPKNGEE